MPQRLILQGKLNLKIFEKTTLMLKRKESKEV